MPRIVIQRVVAVRDEGAGAESVAGVVLDALEGADGVGARARSR